LQPFLLTFSEADKSFAFYLLIAVMIWMEAVHQ